ncbi:RNA polymerase sigma factor [Oceanibacterium hippocampi]|uniref:RNA polymerase sigma factor n=1 Tax=Oceanibacterium hippocampi TaxID=745714 RepID=A0A1Y5U0F9_9PROT|nr:RNA polymerase sigma factor [Oceanibacterium hippocampi]SLN75968.1 RNA polymerase sigma factor [Oceanibacterium hippocampi]
MTGRLCREDRFAAVLGSARPRVVGALTRYFRDLDRAEDAFQTASLRALGSWPERGLPDDPVAWLILAGRNAGIDAIRRNRRTVPLDTDQISDGLDSEEAALERIELDDYRDDILRLLFICCHPAIPQSDQMALALKVVAGLSVREIARAFLVTRKAMEQRITRAKRKVADAGIPFATPSLAERAERLGTVSGHLYLMFNEGYASAGEGAHIRAPLCEEAIRLIRLLLRLFPAQSEIMGLLALCLFQHSRARARLDPDGNIILLDEQDRGLWNRTLIDEGRVLLEKALRKHRPGPYQVQAAIAAVHCAAPCAADTDWAEIDRLYGALESLQPSPVVTLNRAVARAKVAGPEAALALVDGLGDALQGYLYYHGVRGALLAEIGDLKAAREAITCALGLAATAAERQHLEARLAAL